MAMNRQVQLRCGALSVDLDVSPYQVVAGSWTSAGQSLEVQVVVQASTLTELDRAVATLQRLAARAAAYDQMLVGDEVEVWTKTCDDLSYTAEFGATWIKKRVRSLTVLAPDASASATGHYTVTVALSLEVDEVWRRAAPIAALEASAGAVLTYGEGVLYLDSATLTGRRISWNGTQGLTVRVRYLHSAGGDIVFFQTANTAKAWWDNANRRFKIQEDSGTPKTAQSSQYSFAGGQEIEVVFRWQPTTGITIFVNGVKDGVGSSGCVLTATDTYTALSGSFETIYSYQLWPYGTSMSDAYCTGLYAWGRPESEMPVVAPPADDKNTSCLYKLYNGPGDVDAPLRIVLDGAAQDYAQVRLGLRPLRITPTVRWECESGTLGTATASVADASASGGNLARFTPADTAWGTRATVELAADPDDVPALRGEHRLLLACRDAAATVNINQVRWRLVVAGQAEAWSDAKSVAVVSTYSLLDLGIMRLPPGQWPAETLAAVTDVTGGSYVTLELQAKNTAGVGGGVFDLDALILQPAEAEGLLAMTFDVSAYYAMLDWTGERAAFIGVADPRSLEFAAWGDYVGDSLELTPQAGEGGLLVLQWLRDGVEQCYMNDTCDVWLFVEPRYRR